MRSVIQSKNPFANLAASLATRSAVVFGLCFITTPLHAADEPKLSVELSQEEIFEGRSVTYQVIVENVDNPKQPELGDMSDFNVVSRGLVSQFSSAHSVTDESGKTTMVMQTRRVFQYQLTPKKTGELTIAAPMLNVDGKYIQGEAKKLNVLRRASQDLVDLTVTADRQAVYPTQPFSVTMSVFVKQLPAPLTKRDPLSIQRQPVSLQIPWVSDKELPGDVSPVEDLPQWANRYVAKEGNGFSINGLAGTSNAGLFAFPRTIVFRPKPVTVERRVGQGDLAKYERYDFTRTFTAKKVGAVTFEAVKVEGVFLQKIEDDKPVAKEVYAASTPLVVTVNDVPTAGRPDSYCGAIGTFQLAAELSPRESKVGDPLTLTLKLHGAGSMAGVKPPDIAKNAEIANNFKIYEATQKTDADTTNFVYSLRPLTEGDKPFPPVPVSYFDVDQGRYETLETQPLPLKVLKAQQLASDQIVAAPRLDGAAAKDLQARSEGIYANISDANLAFDQSVHPVRWLIGLGGCTSAYIGIAVATSFVRRRRDDRSGIRRRSAPARARQRLREAAEAWQTHDYRAAADRIQDALAGLIADIADVEETSLTPKDVVERLRTWSLAEAVVARVHRLLDTCDAARYGGAASNDSLVAEANQVLDETIKGLRTLKHL